MTSRLWIEIVNDITQGMFFWNQAEILKENRYKSSLKPNQIKQTTPANIIIYNTNCYSCL